MQAATDVRGGRPRAAAGREPLARALQRLGRVDRPRRLDPGDRWRLAHPRRRPRSGRDVDPRAAGRWLSGGGSRRRRRRAVRRRRGPRAGSQRRPHRAEGRDQLARRRGGLDQRGLGPLGRRCVAGAGQPVARQRGDGELARGPPEPDVPQRRGLRALRRARLPAAGRRRPLRLWRLRPRRQLHHRVATRLLRRGGRLRRRRSVQRGPVPRGRLPAQPGDRRGLRRRRRRPRQPARWVRRRGRRLRRRRR